MESCILNPERKKGEPRLPGTGILAVNPADAHGFPALANSLGMTRCFLFNSSLYSSDALFFAGPAVGAPMAAMTLEKLIALGAEKIILYGWAGSLQNDVHAMDVLIPDWGVSEEGTSSHYINDDLGTIVPDKGLSATVSGFLADRKIDFHQGPVWTTDAPYRETEAKVRAYNRKGVCGVDMEFTALCTVAAHRQAKLAAVLLISDELLHVPWTPHYTLKDFKKRSRDLLTLLCEGIESGIL
jgi:uridine phosphorylase